jgi:hypothetical protein
MGLNKESARKTYLTIRDGKIAKKVGEEFEFYNSVEGYITGLSTRETQYGTELNVAMTDGGENFQLQIRIKGVEQPGQASKQSSYFISFAHCAPNIDVNQKVEFIPNLKIVDEKKRSALFLKQNGETLKWAYKKGDGVMPEPEEVHNKKGELISIDWSEVETFRMNKVNELNARLKTATLPKVENKKADGWANAMPPSNSENAPNLNDPEGEELPF